MKNRLLFLALCTCALACDSANPVAPTGSVLSVNANPTQISLGGGSSQITVTGFKPDGNPLNPGTQILVNTDLGNLYNAASGGNLISTIEASGSGTAIAYLRGDGRSGSATVTATLTTGGDVSASATVLIGQSTEDRPSVVISANPTEIAVRTASRISLLGRNSDNTPVSAGQRIRLTSDLGTLVPDGETTPDNPIDSVVTDSNGEAFANYIAGDRAGQGSVSAILGTSDEATVTITINDAPATFSFQASPRLVRASEGDATLDLTVEVLNAQGSPVAGASVIFGANIGGTFASGSGINTTVAGVATDMFTVPQANLAAVVGGSFNVTARVIGEGAELPTQTLPITVDP